MTARFPASVYPGRIGRFQFGVMPIAEGDDGTQINTDRQDFHTYGNIQPFAQVKNKWISGLPLEYGAGSVTLTPGLPNGCDRYRVKIMATAAGRPCLIPAPIPSARDCLCSMAQVSCGRWVHTRLRDDDLGSLWGQRWWNRDCGGNDHSGSRPQERPNVFLIGHDTFVWSPKGFLTGLRHTRFGTIRHALRADRCIVGLNGGRGIPCTGPVNNGAIPSQRILLREWDLCGTSSRRA